MSQLIEIGFGYDDEGFQALCDWLEPQGLVLQEVAVARGWLGFIVVVGLMIGLFKRGVKVGWRWLRMG